MMVQGPLSNEDLELWFWHQRHWNLAMEIHFVATNPFVLAFASGCSTEYSVRLLRAVRFATVIGMLA